MDSPGRPVYASEEARLILASYEVRLDALEKAVSDHAQRFDTLQTPWPKRVLFWLQGWPWYDLNGTRRHRWWHRG